MYACVCHAISEQELRHAIHQRELQSLHDVEQSLGAGACCGSCRERVAFILQDTAGIQVVHDRFLAHSAA